MRLFVVESFYPAYLDQFYKKKPWLKYASFAELRFALLEDRFDALHIFEPIYQDDPTVQFVISNDKHSQLKWAKENGLNTRSLLEIALSQMEHHGTDTLYALDRLFVNSQIVKRLPGTVRKKIVWNASPGAVYHKDIDLVLSSHNDFLVQARNNGLRSAYFTPSHDPVMSSFARNDFRPIDVSFVGSYSDLHIRRNRLLQKIASFKNQYRMVFGLLHPKKRPLLNVPFLRRLPSPLSYVPKNLDEISCGPIFGRDMYGVFSHSKIVLNASGDLGGTEFRGNMRCYEAMGCGSCMVSDAGIYPDGMIDQQTFVSFSDEEDAIEKIQGLLRDKERTRLIGQNASKIIETKYSKASQWRRFQELAAQIL